MKPSPRDSAATRKLLSLLNDKATGRLEVGAGGSTLSVYVLHGEVVAAVSADDERQLLHLLRLLGELPPPALDELEARIDSGASVFGELLTASPPSLDDLLAKRFRQNLCDFVASLEKPTYAPQKGVFVDNIQMGHASRPLVEACCAFATKAQRIDPDQLLVRGPAKPRNQVSEAVAQLLGSEPQTVYALTLKIPMEPTAARCLLVDLVSEGVAKVPGAEPERPRRSTHAPEPPPKPHQRVAPEPAPPSSLPPDDDVESEDGVVQITEFNGGTRAEERGAPPLSDLAPEDNEAEDFNVATEGSGGAPRSLADWLADATHVDDDELDFFSDHDHERGSAEDGAFSTESHNLDKVDVTDFGEEEILEAEEAPSAAKYSSPVLEEDAAEAKIGVASHMLRQIVHAFDEAEGPGAGRAAMQLLVDGPPPKYVALLNGLIVAEDGALPSGRVLANLYARPVEEHRRLINDGLLDLMERALSKAADELPDELFDAVYESVAGYKQRLGL